MGYKRCIIFDKTAERIERDVIKGTQVYLDGKISTSMWETEAGEKRYRTEIIANRVLTLSGKKEREDHNTQRDNKFINSSKSMGNVDDDMPF